MPRLIATALVACFVCLAAPLGAQGLTATPVDSTAAATATVSPAMGNDATAAPAPSASSSLAPVGAHYAPSHGGNAMSASGSHMGLGQSRAMMIVGLGGVLVGAIVGGTAGTVIMVSGAVIGLVGLYEFMQ